MGKIVKVQKSMSQNVRKSTKNKKIFGFTYSEPC